MPRSKIMRRRLRFAAVRHALIQGGEPSRAGALSWRPHLWGSPPSSIIIVIVAGAKATRLRVDRHFAGLPIPGSGHFDISAVAGDDDV
jgi:hypothetical protein